MVTRLLHLPAQQPLVALARHVQHLVDKDRSVLLVSVDVPAGRIFEEFQDQGVNVNRVFVVDASSSRGGIDVHGDPEHVHHVNAPTLLELMAKRVEKILRLKAQGHPHVLILSCNAFAAHNPPEVLEEIVRFVVDQLADPRLRMEFLVDAQPPLPDGLLRFLRGYLDAEASLPAVADK